MKDKLELRMYGLVPYNISPIQQAIQYGHAVVEYANFYFNTPEYQQWAKEDKTFIILNGGTSNDGMMGLDCEILNVGTIQKHITTLKENDITLAFFREPDLNDMISAVVFLVDERVFNKKDYPDFKPYLLNELGEIADNDDVLMSESKLIENYPHSYKKWSKEIGERSVFLKSFLRDLKLA